jgi:hypothetical protein
MRITESQLRKIVREEIIGESYPNSQAGQYTAVKTSLHGTGFYFTNGIDHIQVRTYVEYGKVSGSNKLRDPTKTKFTLLVTRTPEPGALPLPGADVLIHFSMRGEARRQEFNEKAQEKLSKKFPGVTL